MGGPYLCLKLRCRSSGRSGGCSSFWRLRFALPLAQCGMLVWAEASVGDDATVCICMTALYYVHMHDNDVHTPGNCTCVTCPAYPTL